MSWLTLSILFVFIALAASYFLCEWIVKRHAGSGSDDGPALS
jgi:hypothetical protein